MTQIIIGAGIAGIYSAYLAKMQNPSDRVILAEKNSQIGGLLRSFNYPEVGYFDYGIHTVYETGISDIDHFIYSALPESDWVFNVGHKRDFGGTYFNGNLQTNSPYLDARSFSKEQLAKIVASFFDQMKPTQNSYLNAAQYFNDKYGATILEEVITPVLKKVYGMSPEALDPYVAKILPLERMVLFDESVMDAIMSSENIRSRIAYTDQLKLPNHLLPNKKSIYPRQYGMQNLINALEKKISALGVEVLTQCKISDVSVKNNKIDSLKLISQGQENEIKDLRQIYCTTGLISSAQILDLKVDYSDWDRPLQTAIVNFGLKNKPNVKDLFYIYCFAPDFITHRLACPSSFCESSYSTNFYKISAEVILKTPAENIDNILNKVKAEMIQMNIFNSEEILFSKVEMVEGGYPMSSCRNSENIEKLRQKVNSLGLTNYTNIGLMSKKDLFFQTDIMKNVYDYFSSRSL